MTIRWMIRRDMAEVLDIERFCFEFPWDEEDFIRCLRQRNCIGMVALCGDAEDSGVAGFMVYELHANRLHLLDFAVHPFFQRRGVGRAMVAKLRGKLSQQRRTEITLAVGEKNTDAQMFFRAMGFQASGVAQGYYTEPTADAYLMRLGIQNMEHAT